MARAQQRLSRGVAWSSDEDAELELAGITSVVADSLGPDDQVLSLDCEDWPCVVVLLQSDRDAVQDRVFDNGLRVVGIGLEPDRHDLGEGYLMSMAVFDDARSEAAAMQRVRARLLEHWTDALSSDASPEALSQFRPPAFEPW